jgi:peptidylprolyl isomerase
MREPETGLPVVATGIRLEIRALSRQKRRSSVCLSNSPEKPPMRVFRAGLVALSALVIAGSAVMSGRSDAQSAKAVTTPSGLQIIDIKVGAGASPKKNQTAVVHYTGWLYEKGKRGKKFDSSVDRKEPFRFPVGAGQVIAGWDEGVASMRVGGQRTLIVPPQLGYGARGAGGVIPPNATLIFDVELLGLN